MQPLQRAWRIAQHRTDDARLGARMTPYHDILQRRHIGKQADILERARNAELEHLMRFHAQQGTAFEIEITVVGLYRPGDDIEQRGFTRAIGTDQTVNFTCFDVAAIHP